MELSPIKGRREVSLSCSGQDLTFRDDQITFRLKLSHSTPRHRRSGSPFGTSCNCDFQISIHNTTLQIKINKINSQLTLPVFKFRNFLVN